MEHFIITIIILVLCNFVEHHCGPKAVNSCIITTTRWGLVCDRNSSTLVTFHAPQIKLYLGSTPFFLSTESISNTNCAVSFFFSALRNSLETNSCPLSVLRSLSVLLVAVPSLLGIIWMPYILRFLPSRNMIKYWLPPKEETSTAPTPEGPMP